MEDASEARVTFEKRQEELIIKPKTNSSTPVEEVAVEGLSSIDNSTPPSTPNTSENPPVNNSIPEENPTTP